jgi:hypothetical protein
MILINDGTLYHIITICENSNITYDEKIYQNNFLDIINSEYNTNFYIGLLKNKKILLLGNNIESQYTITDKLDTYLTNIKEIKIYKNFIFVLTWNNIAIM